MAKITTFDGKTIHARRVKDPITDDTLPPMGSLNWSSIASSTALSGTTGADCSKVKGDRQLTADGKLTEKYTGDKLIEVQGNHKESTRGNRSITVETGNLERKVSAGKVTDQIALSHEETVGMSYKLTAMKQDFQASAMVTIVGGLVKINS